MGKGKIPLSQVVLVEGRYDKNKVSQIFDAVILEVNGFSIFKDREKAELIRRMALLRGVVVLTDPDSAGQMIRNQISRIANGGNIYHAYVPDLKGKEPRKEKPSGEGKLGVEGLDDDIIIEAVRRSGAMSQGTPDKTPSITKQDLYRLGLSGCANSREKRKALARRLQLPEAIAPPALLKVLNALLDVEELEALIQSLGFEQP